MSAPIYATRDQTAEAIWRMEQSGTGAQVHLLRAVLRGEITALFLPAGGRVPPRLLTAPLGYKPLVVVVGDDCGLSAGPTAFPQARRLFRWARWMMLHGAGGEPWHYAMAAEAALLMGRVLIVETSSAGLPAWVAFKADHAPLVQGVSFRVPEGLPAHPAVGVLQ